MKLTWPILMSREVRSDRQGLIFPAGRMRRFLCNLLRYGRIFPCRVTVFFVWQCERSRKICLSCSDRRVPAPDTQLLGFGGLSLSLLFEAPLRVL